VDAEPDAQLVAVGPRHPGVVRVERVRVAELEQLLQAQLAAHRLLALRAGAQPQRRELAGQGLRALERQLVGRAQLDAAVGGGAGERAVGRDVEHHRRRVRRPWWQAGQVQHGRALDARARHQVVGAVDLAAVEHDDQVRPGHRVRAVLGVEPRPAAEQVLQHHLEHRDARREQAQLPERVPAVRVQRVRQPLEPLPLGALFLPGAHGDAQVVRRLQRGELRDDRADETAGAFAAGDVHAAEPVHRHRERQAGDRRVRGDEPPQRQGGQRFQVLEGFRVRRDEVGGEALPAGADAGDREVRVAAPALPQAEARHERPQVRRVGVQVRHRRALPACRAADPHAVLREPAQVQPACLPHLLLAGAARVQERHQHHREHGHAEEPEDDVADHGETAGGPEAAEHQHHRGHHQDHRQHHERLRPLPRRWRRDLRRWLERQVAGRHVRRRPAQWPAYDDRAHDFLPRRPVRAAIVTPSGVRRGAGGRNVPTRPSRQVRLVSVVIDRGGRWGGGNPARAQRRDDRGARDDGAWRETPRDTGPAEGGGGYRAGQG
jgi:hypothetical protein